ncbi:anti-sigma factor [Chitinophaga barathri]|uniref:Anti-sigma factor n=1 Tax=Chitinophaga barathri TaxID=1647451 RepID=A0A3N4N039_9BACT|nr:anti-sigma factor [Chitinophaga barathri]RPD40983.1 anti-sigma factor [Chitinophaga barathri]
MDVQRYISSGIIESFVAGLATDQEVRELQASMVQFPEIKAAVEAVQLDMERYVNMQSVTPPEVVKDRVFQLINNEGVETAVPVSGGSYSEEESGYPDEPKVVQLVSPVWKYVAAAAIIGLLASVWMNVQYFNSSNEWQGKYQALLTDKDKMMADNQVMQTRMDESEKMLSTLRTMKMVPMYTVTPTRPGLLATVYWNPKSEEVLLTVNNLPAPAPDQQYQLWGIVNGKPVDAGVFDMDKASKGFAKMKTMVAGAQMFAITLEKKGGSPTPTLTAMYVAGKVSG